jgi:hypothetical protein
MRNGCNVFSVTFGPTQAGDTLLFDDADGPNV